MDGHKGRLIKFLLCLLLNNPFGSDDKKKHPLKYILAKDQSNNLFLHENHTHCKALQSIFRCVPASL